ncbi:hypothetical protein V5E97_15395 [Singulisphaera sp. Ch08]|uniref:Uncharacterized protein n=1 Tax=Singulisphaera sp. Ch08 TaxID=3120278 RepID=A0AAU7CQ45_9BACT
MAILQGYLFWTQQGRRIGLNDASERLNIDANFDDMGLTEKYRPRKELFAGDSANSDWHFLAAGPALPGEMKYP